MDSDLNDALAMLGAGYEVDAPPVEVFGTSSGYTPTPDILCKKYGFVTAMVWGRVWRFCQGRDGVCRAKLATIAQGLGMSERTIIRHMDVLVKGGYFTDLTPSLRNKPHTYADTHKLRLAFSTDIIEARVTESQSVMTESHRQGDRESHEDSNNNRQKNKLSEKSLKDANKKVDAILENERKAPGKSWTSLPEVCQPFAREFCAATGLPYSKKQASDWLATIYEWMELGVQPADVAPAVQAAQKSGTDISRPGSITYKLKAARVSKHLASTPAPVSVNIPANNLAVDELSLFYAQRSVSS